MQVLLGEAHAADVDRAELARLLGADDELGRAAADVDDEVRTGLVERRGRAEELEARLFLAGQAARAGRRAPARPGRRTRRGCAASRDALVAVARTRSTPRSSMTLPVARAARRACARSRRACSTRSRSTPWPSRVIRVRRSIVTSFASRPVPSTSATSSRVEFVPMSTLATLMRLRPPALDRLQTARGRPGLRSAPDFSSEVLLDPAADGIVAAREEVGVVRVQALHARGVCRRRRRAGRGPTWPARQRARRARRAYRSCAARSASGSTAASAPRTPPADSSRATRTAASGSTSQ